MTHPRTLSQVFIGIAGAAACLIALTVAGGCATTPARTTWLPAYDAPYAEVVRCWQHVPRLRPTVQISRHCQTDADGKQFFVAGGIEVVGWGANNTVVVCPDYTRYSNGGMDLIRHEMSHLVCVDKLGADNPACANYSGRCWL